MKVKIWKDIIHLGNPEIFNYSEDRECFKHFSELIVLFQPEQKSNDIIISSPFPFNKAGNIHPQYKFIYNSLKSILSKKNVKLIDNTCFINKQRHNTSVLKGTKDVLYKFLTAYGAKNSTKNVQKQHFNYYIDHQTSDSTKSGAIDTKTLKGTSDGHI